MDNTDKKNRLEDILRSYGSAAVAFSGGVDSSFLLRTARDVLGDRAFAVTARTNTFPEREILQAEEFCGREGIRQYGFDFNVLDAEGFTANPPERCYICKKALFTRIKEIAAQNGAAYVLEGSNLDDEGDFRPGMRAVAELGIKSPLREAGLTKADIRTLSRGMGLDTWNKPSFACLATRIPYGDEITAGKLEMVGEAEQFLIDLGFGQVRVRFCKDTARIEILPEEFKTILDEGMRGCVYDKFNELGFNYVTLDLKGYRSGSMNEILEDTK